MREIKFRAWSKDKKCFVFPGEGFATNLTYWADSRTISVYQHENIVLTQYTGLYDRNGVEIYEGDIVLVDDSWKGVVRYWQGCFMVDDDVLGAIHSFSEVIGNIYENTELLEAAE